MKRFSIVAVIVATTLLMALPAAAKPGKPGKPPADTALFDVTMEFDGDSEGLSTGDDAACGMEKTVTMEWDGRYLLAVSDPMIDVRLGGPESGFSWYRDYPYFASPGDMPADFDPAAYPYDPPLSGDTMTGCHGAGIDVYVDANGPGDHEYVLRSGLFRLKPASDSIELLWHSDYYALFEKTRKKWTATTVEDFTYSGGLAWTTATPWNPATGASGTVTGELHVSHYSPSVYIPFADTPRPVEFILTVTPHSE